MITVTLQRDKCIGCNYCREHAPQCFTMSQKDGKALLINSRDKRGFHSVKLHNVVLDACMNAAKACPVNIIKIAE